mmetsp:Transcript_29851/g.71744  ORF Transcript_29851/g.71744 Transcript_29851/m.71744 type:complete len:468 (-) Transcript_29851:3955-5358(-)
MAEFFNSTPSEQVVRQVATIIGVEETIVDDVCQRMQEEFVLQEWQLSALDASEWKALGAPIGLAAAIRKLASVEDDGKSLHKPRKPTSTPTMLSSRSPYAQQLTDATKGATVTTDKNDIEVFKPIDEDNEQGVQDSGDDDSVIEAGNGRGKELPSTPNSTFDVLYNNHRDVCKAFHSTTFPMSDTFNRALLHSKSGDDLKAHTVFSMEISVVVAVLLLGAAIDMWGGFPETSWDKTGITDGGEPYVPYTLAIVFHVLSFVTIVIQLMGVFLNVGQLVVATAVCPEKFHQFFQQVSVTTAWTNGLFHCGVVTFVVNIGVLAMAMILQATSDRWVIRICGLIIPALVVLPCEVFFHLLLTYIGRAAFNGFLLVPHEDPNSEDIIGGADSSAAIAERTLCQNYFHQLNPDDELVLDRIQRLRKGGDVATSRTKAKESKTIRNSKLIVPTARKHNIGPAYFPKFQGVKKST